MPLVAIYPHAATLAPMTHLAIFDTDAPIFGDAFAQAGGTSLRDLYILLLDELRRCQALLNHGSVTARRLGVQPPFDSVEHPQHDRQGPCLLPWIIPIQVQGRLQTRPTQQPSACFLGYLRQPPPLLTGNHT